MLLTTAWQQEVHVTQFSEEHDLWRIRDIVELSEELPQPVGGETHQSETPCTSDVLKTPCGIFSGMRTRSSALAIARMPSSSQSDGLPAHR
jgi:hypothetical protein